MFRSWVPTTTTTTTTTTWRAFPLGFGWDRIQSTPPELRMRACRLVASKSTLAARVDSTRGDPMGNTGRNLRQEILEKINKWQELPPPRQPKPLPVPLEQPRKKRGGCRLRKRKDKYAVTDRRKLANRVQFAVPEETSLGGGLGRGYGILGQAGSGKLRVSSGARVAKKFKARNYASMCMSGAASGLSSSLAFSPIQGLQLSNPQAHDHQLRSGAQSTYFSETWTFSRSRQLGALHLKS